MRVNINQPGANKLRYEIRQIIEIAHKVETLGIPITWENIGDPIAKGEKIPEWIRAIVGREVLLNSSYAYSPTQGLSDTLSYIAKERNLEGGISITPDDILFFNGLGDAITRLYSNLHPGARVIGPNPAYPTHSASEAAHANAPHITYRLDPERKWEPDLVDMENSLRKHKEITGILIINPDNPTGFVYPQETLKKIVSLAQKYDLFIISDEIYSNLAYEHSNMRKLASVIEDVPAIAMRGISKEFPWPGARSGWIEFYNRSKDTEFDRYASSLLNVKMLEVCSTTLPQQVLPYVMSDARYYPYLKERVKRYEARSQYTVSVLATIPGLITHVARGAFYQTIVFKNNVLKNNQSLVLSKTVHSIIEPHLETASLDQRFVYYLLAATGICVVPLSTGFNSDSNGFRMTLLEPDDEKFHSTIDTLFKAINTYLAS